MFAHGRTLGDYAWADSCSVVRGYVDDAVSGRIAVWHTFLGEMTGEGSKPSATFEVTRVGLCIGSIRKRKQRDRTEQQPHPGPPATGAPLGAGNGSGEHPPGGFREQRIGGQGEVRETAISVSPSIVGLPPQRATGRSSAHGHGHGIGLIRMVQSMCGSTLRRTWPSGIVK